MEKETRDEGQREIGTSASTPTNQRREDEMTRSHVAVLPHGFWDTGDGQKILNAYKNGEMTAQFISEEYGITKAALEARMWRDKQKELAGSPTTRIPLTSPVSPAPRRPFLPQTPSQKVAGEIADTTVRVRLAQPRKRKVLDRESNNDLMLARMMLQQAKKARVPDEKTAYIGMALVKVEEILRRSGRSRQ